MKTTAFLIAFWVVGLSQAAQAATYAYPLEDLVGAYVTHDKRVVAVDLGITFDDISGLSIDWSGDVTAALAYSQFPLPDGGHTFVTPAGFCVTLYTTVTADDIFAQVFHAGGVEAYPLPESFDLGQSFSDYGWHSFYDGLAFLELSFMSGPSFPESYLLEYASGNIYAASLLIEGEAVPEPAGMVLLAAGWVGLRARGPKASKP
ncbi:MAG: hypothetical protein JW810_02645, partial [Sedimentisphaerales bacterium]|nr:hypothetical protein [Sedimentisphaerales bacterium]